MIRSAAIGALALTLAFVLQTDSNAAQRGQSIGPQCTVEQCREKLASCMGKHNSDGQACEISAAAAGDAAYSICKTNRSGDSDGFTKADEKACQSERNEADKRNTTFVCRSRKWRSQLA